MLQGDRVVRRVPLVTAAEVKAASLPRRMLHSVGGPLTLLAGLAILLGVVALVMRRARA